MSVILNDDVSIRAALTGGDDQDLSVSELIFVSIRAALTGGDLVRARAWRYIRSFNPRRPHGRRQDKNDDTQPNDLRCARFLDQQ